jgi:hypothetical protein
MLDPNTGKEVTMKWKAEDGGWSPYLAEALVGVLAIVSVYATTQWMGKTNYLGASTTFVRAAGLLEQGVRHSTPISSFWPGHFQQGRK